MIEGMSVCYFLCEDEESSQCPLFHACFHLPYSAGNGLFPAHRPGTCSPAPLLLYFLLANASSLKAP